MSWDRELEVAVAAVRQASRACRSVQRDVDPHTLEKSDRSPVTVADFASQALVARALLEAFPEDPLVAEEDAAALREPAHAARLRQVHARVSAEVTADADEVLRWIDHGGATKAGARAWVLDPVDGTKGFLRGEQYAVALALLVNGEVMVGALACPNLPLTDAPGAPVGAVLLAVRGSGTRMAPLFESEPPSEPSSELPFEWGAARVVRVSERDDVTTLRLCESVESGHTAHDHSAAFVERLGITASPVRLDSQAKYGVVARGDAELYLRLPTRPGYREKVWDHAAGALVVQEAGGTVTDVDGRPLDFGRGRELLDNRGVVVSHGRHHERVLATLAALGV